MEVNHPENFDGMKAETEVRSVQRLLGTLGRIYTAYLARDVKIFSQLMRLYASGDTAAPTGAINSV